MLKNVLGPLLSTDFPRELPILPLRNSVAFPFTILPISVGIERSVKLVEDAQKDDHLIGIVAVKVTDILEPLPSQLYEVGTVAKIERVMQTADNSLNIVVHCLERFKIDNWVLDRPYLKARLSYYPDTIEEGGESEALRLSLVELAREIIALSPNFPEETADILSRVKSSLSLTYLVANYSGLEMSKAQEILEESSVNSKMRLLIDHLSQEREILSMSKKIQNEAREKISKVQREYYLRQQLSAIQKELAEHDEGQAENSEYAIKIANAELPQEARKEANRELKRLEGMSSLTPEASIIKSYLDWILELPWNRVSEERTDINSARKILDEDHYGLSDVKERILEYLAVHKMAKDRGVKKNTEKMEATREAYGAILCFSGPPGVGKTSLGRSIARALERNFTRVSLGGMRDEAEIRGHRRTYIGALPGRIIQAIKRAGTRNPVFMLDEIDKIGMDWRGDPSSALLEVLDPAQNNSFRDHYLDIDFDLSEVIFITTANQLDTIPPALRDRIEIIAIEGYTSYEKLEIAKRHLIPRQLKSHGLREDEVIFNDQSINKLIEDYTKEVGVRNLERQISAICRKSVVQILDRQSTNILVTEELVRVFLKQERFLAELAEKITLPGIATGLAVTTIGGDILFIEASKMRGKGALILTGHLGEIMRESAQLAHSYIRSKAEALSIPADAFEMNDLHLHIPAGAIPKDGPSAGLAMTLAIASLFSDRTVRGDVGMTGEITLRGRVLPVGGIKMKVLAAHRAGLKMVILPKRNQKDLEELPEEIAKQLHFILVEKIDEAIDVALSSLHLF
ncbi:MAG: endopeptidase La [Oligoflexia bacterium]|nr:endopeptidase La [Oligoflexia bacterium]MBF0367734.1 endopeptidase La [Oligoflexia bacterium]